MTWAAVTALVAGLVAVGAVVAGCGVPLQDRPEQLVAPEVPATPTPTVTNRPDPTPTIPLTASPTPAPAPTAGLTPEPP